MTVKNRAFRIISMHTAASFKYLFSILGAVLIAACAPQPDPRTPEQIVTEYLRLDFAGAQLSKQGAEALSALTTRSVNYQENPTIFLATDYAIRDFRIHDNKATTIIRYRPIGLLKEMYTFEPYNKIWSDPINLKRQSGGWRVEPESAVVEAQAAIRSLKQILEQNPSAIDEWKTHIRNTIEQIEACAEDTRHWPDPGSMSAEALLKAYLDMDAAGRQLTDEGRDAMQGLISSRLHVEALRVIHLTKGYEIVSREMAADRAVFGVMFHNIGILEDDLVFNPKRDDSRIEIALIRHRDGWEIETPLAPQISWQAIIEMFNKENLALEREAAQQGRSHQKGISINEQLIQKITRAAQEKR